MRSVTIEKSELLSTLITNRDNHHAEFLAALEAYRLEAIEVLEAAVEAAKTGKQIMRQTDLVEPMDMTKEYNRVIKMLKMSVDSEIELSSTEFQNYVMDDWSWSVDASVSNFAYTSKWSN